MKILLISGPRLGHIGRLITIAKALKNQNDSCNILFALPDSSESIFFLQEEEFEFSLIPVDEIGLQLNSFPKRIERAIFSYKPNIIIVDWNALHWGAAIVWPEVPRIYVTNIFLTTLMHEDVLQDKSFALHKIRINNVRLKRNLPPVENYRDLYLADYVYLADPTIIIKNLAANKSNLSKMIVSSSANSARFLPLNRQPQLPAPFVNYGAIFYNYTSPGPQYNSTSKCIVVSMGSSGEKSIHPEDVSILRKKLGVDSIVWVGGNKQEWFQSFGIKYFKKISLPPLLDNAILAITQGGAGSSYQALSRGVPILTIPTHANHAVLGKLLSKLGVGKLIEEINFLNDNFDLLKSNAEIWKESISTE